MNGGIASEKARAPPLLFLYPLMKVMAVLLLAVAPCLRAAENTALGYPRISRLNTQDLAFRQYLTDVEAARRRIFNMGRTGETPGNLAESLTIYAYTPETAEDLFLLAARCNVPYATVATMNRFSHPASLENTGPLLLSSMPGIFIPESPNTDLERLLAARTDQGGITITVNRTGERENFRFIPGADFTPTERAFFLNREFRFPLRAYRITSGFGMRISPITGVPRPHGGLDLAAPEGTDVFAAREGVVTELGEDPVYGKYVIIQHGENWVSLYGHLSSINTVLRNTVRSGTLIGKVGSTGLSTGPHLHFELRQNGTARDPGRLLFREGIQR
jgi:hypothetical protein